ncbi:MAG TPA: hypothetical protein VED22_06645 [Nitrososphaerales archaeon]|nr:hypothetical protein [Nitrososphaerales archaeon]
MRQRLRSLTLIAVLFAVSLALGLVFGGGGLAGTASNPGLFQLFASKGPSGNPPTVVVQAEGISPHFLYESSFYPSVPSSMLVPLAGLRIVLKQVSAHAASSQVYGPARILLTNSSGAVEALADQGNYSVQVETNYVQLNTTISCYDNTTTILSIRLLPSPTKIDSLRIVSQDSVVGLEPTTRLYALLANETIPSTGFAELVGFQSTYPEVTSGATVAVNSTILGSYSNSLESFVVLSPSGPYSTFPTLGIVLFQFRPVYGVNYTAG